MPWWIWPILVLFMLAMIAAGLVYAGLHGFHAVQDIAEIGGRLGERVSKMGEPGAAVHAAAECGAGTLCRRPCRSDTAQERHSRTPYRGLEQVEAVQQVDD